MTILQSARSELSGLVEAFNSAIFNTNQSVSKLKETADGTDVRLRSYIEKAEELGGDLSFMTDAAAKLADKLEVLIAQAKEQAQILESVKAKAAPTYVYESSIFDKNDKANKAIKGKPVSKSGRVRKSSIERKKRQKMPMVSRSAKSTKVKSSA